MAEGWNRLQKSRKGGSQLCVFQPRRALPIGPVDDLILPLLRPALALEEPGGSVHSGGETLPPSCMQSGWSGVVTGPRGAVGFSLWFC